MKEITRNDFNLFQNEILGLIKKSDSKSTEKITELIANLQKTELISDQKFENYKFEVDSIVKNLETNDTIVKLKQKIDELNSQIEEIKSVNENKISKFERDLSNACFKYDKIFLNNISSPGLIGDGCPYPTMKAFLVYANNKIKDFISSKDKFGIDFKKYHDWVQSSLDKFKDEIVENNIYEITGGYIRTADKRFDPPGSDYKLILNESSVITLKNDDEKNFKDKFEDPDNKFWNLTEIKEAPINTIANVVCVVTDKGETNYKDTKSGSILIRKLFVLDQSNEKMELTLWRNLTQLNINNGDILVCKKVRVNDFGGKNLTSTTESKIFINPIITDFPEISKEIQSLKVFSEQNELNKGINQEQQNNNEKKKDIIINNNNSLNKSEINNSSNNLTPKKEFNDKIVYIDYILEEMNKYILTDFDHRFPFYKIRATVTHLGHTEKNFYPGCPNRECNRKLTYSNGDWICQSCRQSFKFPKYYYSLNIRVKDCSSEYWVDIFGKPAEMIMNISADDYRNILVNRDEEKLGQISEGVEYKEFYFLLKVRLNKYNDTTKKKFTATKIEKINKKENTIKLINDIKMKLGI